MRFLRFAAVLATLVVASVVFAASAAIITARRALEAIRPRQANPRLMFRTPAGLRHEASTPTLAVPRRY